MHHSTDSTLHNLLEDLITKANLTKEQPQAQSAALWWKKQWQQDNAYLTDNLTTSSLSLIYLAFQSPNFSSAFVVAYQFALRKMFPELASNSNLSCLCVSEKAGNSPKAIDTYLKDQKVTGEKTFVTCANHIDTLLIMLDNRDAEPDQGHSKSLRLLQIDKVQTLASSSFQLTLSPYNEEKFLPDIGKGSLLLSDFSIESSRLLKGEAHESFSKPFSVLEGLCIRLAMCSHLLKWACVYQWPKALQGDLILQISALENSLESSPLSSSTQIIIDSQSRILENVIQQIDELANNNMEFKAHWQRDKICLYMDFRLRTARLKKAWFELSAD